VKSGQETPGVLLSIQEQPPVVNRRRSREAKKEKVVNNSLICEFASYERKLKRGSGLHRWSACPTAHRICLTDALSYF
jgi:hypothetical protein